MYVFIRGRLLMFVLQVFWISDGLVIESLANINVKPALLHRGEVINVV